MTGALGQVGSSDGFRRRTVLAKEHLQPRMQIRGLRRRDIEVHFINVAIAYPKRRVAAFYWSLFKSNCLIVAVMESSP
jgi:hypothetical protein